MRVSVAQRFGVVASLAMLAAFAACQGDEPKSAPPPSVDTVDVGAAPDAALSTEKDRVEQRRQGGFSGVLPGTFPKDLPVYEPSTLVDFGRGAGGGYALFQTTDAVGVVSGRYPAQLVARGWERDGADAFRRGNGRVRVTFENARPGTRIRVEY
jgi:hypothetical protein